MNEFLVNSYKRVSRLYNTIRTPYKQFVWNNFSFGKLNSKKVNLLKDKHKGERCFVICNGPSLSKMNLDNLKNEITIGSNGIFLLSEELDFTPTYYTIEDRLVAEDRFQEANEFEGSTKIFPDDLSNFLKVNNDSDMYVHFRRSYMNFPKFSTDLADHAYWGGTVTMFNLQLAYYIGCNPVYLIGCDHNYTIPENHKPDYKGRITSKVDDCNHFHPDYFGPGYRWHDPKVDRMEQGYKLAKNIFEDSGRRVVNATSGGKLEVFERISFDSIFELNDRNL